MDYLNSEHWTPVEGFEERYLISDDGQVLSLAKSITDIYKGKPRIRKEKQVLHKLKTDKKGYKRVSLRDGIKTHDRLVHRLVAIAFIPNPLNLPCVNHIDCNPSNNKKENLEWCTPKQNSEHASKNGLMNKDKFMKPVDLFSKTDELIESYDSIRHAGKLSPYSRKFIYTSLKKGKTHQKTKEYFKYGNKEKVKCLSIKALEASAPSK